MAQKRIVIRSWPKMIYAWPTAFCALAVGLVALYLPDWTRPAGLFFLMIFLMNLTVLTFEFGRTVSLTVAIGMIAVLFGSVLANQSWGFLAPAQQWVRSRQFVAHPEFFFAIAAIYAFLYLCMYIATRFDYWRMSENELVHKRGIFGDIERYSTSGLKMKKEINDIFEYMIGGGGRLIFFLPNVARPIILDNVLGIKQISQQAGSLLDAKVVRLQTPPSMVTAPPMITPSK